MGRAEQRRRYRGKKPRGGLTAEQVAVAFLAAVVTILAITIHANCEWSGKSPEEQLYEALFVTKDWE